MAKIAVYDWFYRRRHPHNDIVGEALKGSEHDLVASSWTIREAAAQIINFASRAADDRPDIVILGGRLEDDSDYARNPFSISEPCKVERRIWLGRTKEVDGQRTTFMLPQFHSDMVTYHFPVVEATAPLLPDEVAEQWVHRQLGIAAAVLSRVAQTYLPDTKRLGISSDIMFDAELDAEVLRGPGAALQLRQQIEQFAES